MKRKIITTLLTAAAFTIPAWSQLGQSDAETKDTPSRATSSQSNPSPSATEPTHTQQSQQTTTLLDATQLEKQKVFDTNGKEIGKLKHVLLDSKTGRARYGILKIDKEWNLNDPEIIVPWGAFEIRAKSHDEHAVILDASKDKLEKAPRFEKDRLNELGQRTFAEPIFSYWAVLWIDELRLEQSGAPAQPTTTQPSSRIVQPPQDQPQTDQSQPDQPRSSQPAPNQQPQADQPQMHPTSCPQ